MATESTIRFSNPNIDERVAKSYTWESPLPKNRFWDSIEYQLCHTFLVNFTPEERDRLPVDPNSAAPNAEKIETLLRLLRQKLTAEEAAVAPRPLQQADYPRWAKLQRAIFWMLTEQGHLDEADRIIRMLKDTAPTSTSFPWHIWASHLARMGNYTEAEASARPFLADFEAREKLGPDSPQALASRRTLLKALWGQGQPRRVEAEAMVVEYKSILDGMGGGKFAVYQDEERGLYAKVLAEIALMDKE